ncbi:MAG: 4-phospho-D-threonate 3-dehydrogenase, partial [Lachnospiraceae bacterium]|nr:4-phospho-D-threonate 3-dehydrogenase [Lachnospiraceae bacterium]
MKAKRNIVIPIGDIAGVGPEIVVKALNHPEVYEWCNPVVVGECPALERALSVAGLSLELQ